MLVIPVIDLMNGQVVRARRGERASYRPIETPLAKSSMPLDVVRGLLAVAPFPVLYAADLDAIQSRGEHRSAMTAIRTAHPGLACWVDAGFGNAAAIETWASAGIRPVVGTETLPDAATLAAILEATPDAVLSLDTRAGVPQGPPALFRSPALWPGTVIVMTLDRVGAGAGPDVERLRALRDLSPDTRWVAAGGVRHEGDLELLEALGVHAVLIASAIHDGALDALTLARYCTLP